MSDREIASFFTAYRANGRNPLEAMNGMVPENGSRDRVQLMETIFEIRKDIHLLSPSQLVDLSIRKLPVLSVAGLAYGKYRNTVAPPESFTDSDGSLRR